MRERFSGRHLLAKRPQVWCSVRRNLRPHARSTPIRVTVVAGGLGDAVPFMDAVYSHSDDACCCAFYPFASRQCGRPSRENHCSCRFGFAMCRRPVATTQAALWVERSCAFHMGVAVSRSLDIGRLVLAESRQSLGLR